jgi:AmpD protein
MPEPSIRDGWLLAARRVPSPNANNRPDEQDISLLVIHNISLPPGQFGQRLNGSPIIETFFCNQLPLGAHPFLDTIHDMQVSAHLLIYRTGEIVQFVPFSRRAWHAGQSCFQKRQNCNDFSIGIELEGDDNTAFTESQYQVLAQVVNQLLIHYPGLDKERIVGHSDIAPGRKTDPGPYFDWQLFYRLLEDS